MEISEVTRKLLEKAGWATDRTTDISLYEKVLAADGYTINNTTQEFLRQFGGLEITHTHFRVANVTCKINFDHIHVVNGIFRERVETYEEQIGETLVVVGEIRSRHSVLMISISGKIYAGFDDNLIRFGNNAIEAQEIMCKGKETVKIE